MKLTNILRSIVPGIRLYLTLANKGHYKRDILRARAVGDVEAERAAIRGALTEWGEDVVRVLKIDLHVTGQENLPKEGPVVVVGNHQGYADIFVSMLALNTFPYGFVAKEPLRKLPLYGYWMELIRSVFIARNDPRSSLRTIESGIDNIKQGFSMFIFPEGKRSKGGPMDHFKHGALRLATKPGVPIVPVTISGTNGIFEDNGYIKSGVRVEYYIHPVVETAGLDRKEAAALSDKIEDMIRAKLVEFEGEKALLPEIANEKEEE